MSPRTARTWFAASAASSLIGFGAIAWVSVGAGTFPSSVVLPCFLLLPIPALILAARLPAIPSAAVPYSWIAATGLALRLFFFASEPALSDDAYRYLWDGRVQLAGHSPYGVAPLSPELDGVEASWPAESRVRSRVNHPEIPTAYPPLLQIVFLGVAACGGGLFHWRLVLLLAEFGIGSLVARGLVQRGRDSRLAVLYWWHPLPVFESIWSAHAEAIAVLWLVLAAWYCTRERNAPGGAFLVGLGGSAKLLPLGLVPWLLRRAAASPVVAVPVSRSRRVSRVLLTLGVCGVTVLATTLPYVGSDLDRATQGLRSYVQGWYFNDVLFRWLGLALGFDPEDQTLFATKALRACLSLAGAFVCVAAAYKARSSWRACLWIAAGFVVLTPTLHPWYLLWLLPFSIVLSHPAWYLMTITVLASYVVLVGWREFGVWIELVEVRVLEFVPVVGWLLVRGVGRLRSRSRTRRGSAA